MPGRGAVLKKNFERIAIVGCGKMGRIYRKVFDPLCDRFLIVDPRAADDLETRPYATLGDVPGDLVRPRASLVHLYAYGKPLRQP